MINIMSFVVLSRLNKVKSQILKMFLIYLPLVLTVLYFTFYCYFTRTFNYWKKRNVAGPEPVAIFGNLKESALRQKNAGIVFQEYYNMFPKEKVVGIYRMTTPCLLIRDLEIIKHIMIKDFDLFRGRGIDFSNKGLGQNMFHADGETWTDLRRKFNPIYTPGKLRNMFHLLYKRADIFINHLDDMIRTNPEYEIYSLIKKYTVSAIFACAFGVDLDTFHSEHDDTLQTIDDLILTPTYASELDMMYPGLLKKLNLSLFPASVKDFFDKLVTDIITQRNGQPSARGDFMDLILSLRQTGEINGTKNKDATEDKMTELTDDMIAAQAFVFYIAGFETSTTTMTYLLYQIALNPEIQDKLLEDIDRVTNAHNGEITYESIKEMKYLDKAFNETLRMYSIVEPLQRKAKCDYAIPGTDVVIEKDQIVLVSVRGIHYDEKYYPNPEIFDPDRFDPELVSARHPCAYMPFGVGPRNCIGMRFGSLQSRLCIAKMLLKFRVEPSENTKIPLGVHPNRALIAPKENIILNIVPRKR